MNEPQQPIAKTLGLILHQHHKNLDSANRQLAMYQNLMEICPLPMVITDQAGSVTFVNRAYCRFLGTSAAVVERDGWKRFVDPTGAEEVQAAWLRAVQNQQILVEGEVVFLTPQGRIPCQYRMTAVHEGYGGFIILPKDSAVSFLYGEWPAGRTEGT